MTIDLCWQGFLGFVKDYPALFTAVAFLLFWFLRYAFGHKMYRLTCWRIPDEPNGWWKYLDLHDWHLSVEPSGFQHSENEARDRCTRCLSLRRSMMGGHHYIWASDLVCPPVIRGKSDQPRQVSTSTEDIGGISSGGISKTLPASDRRIELVPLRQDAQL